MSKDTPQNLKENSPELQLPIIGEEVIVDNGKSQYMHETWKMLGEYTYTMESDIETNILLGCVPEKFGGAQALSPLLTDILRGNYHVKTAEDYVKIKKAIREIHGVYADYTRQEFFEMQERAINAMEQLAADHEAIARRIREKIASIR
jgi:hypothetical protein